MTVIVSPAFTLMSDGSKAKFFILIVFSVRLVETVPPVTIFEL